VVPLAFVDSRVDTGPGGEVAQAMRDEIAAMYDGLDLGRGRRFWAEKEL
jgi:hypothetical protein